jgi:hypothetical protein
MKIKVNSILLLVTTPTTGCKLLKGNKMKYFLIMLLTVIFMACSSSTYRREPPKNQKERPQEKKATPEQTQHEFVKEYTDISKDLIFERAIKWIAQNFKSAKQVIDYQDKSAGTLIAKGIIPDVKYEPSIGPEFGRVVKMSFTLTLDIKDGKARFDYTNVKAVSDADRDIIYITETEIFQMKAHSILNDLTEQI